MGHAWTCDDCGIQVVGFGDPGEYNGKPGGKESNPKDQRAEGSAASRCWTASSESKQNPDGSYTDAEAM
jgi:hypothetical protein